MHKSFSSNQLKQVGRLLLASSGNKSSFSHSTKLFNLNEEWKKMAEKKLKGKSVDTLTWETSEVKTKQKLNDDYLIIIIY